MKQKCLKCGKEGGNLYHYGTLCATCDDKRERNDVIFGVIAILFVLALVAGLRLVWAHYVYHDYRCFLAECRLLK